MIIGKSLNASEAGPGSCSSWHSRYPALWLAEQVDLKVDDGSLCWLVALEVLFLLLDDDDDDEPEDDDQEIKDKTLPKWQIWLAAERSRDQRHWRPWRPDKTKKQTEEDCEDPERQASTGPPPGRQGLLFPHSCWALGP